MLTQHSQPALFTLRFAGNTGVSSMQNEPMMSNGNKFVGDVAREFFLHTIGSGATCWNEPYAMTHTEHMGIYRKGSLTPHYGLNDIGGLTPHTG